MKIKLVRLTYINAGLREDGPRMHKLKRTVLLYFSKCKLVAVNQPY